MTATTTSSIPAQKSTFRRFLASPKTARALFPVFVIAVWNLIYFTIY